MAQFGSSNETSFWQDFTNNLATDLAPIIALFGEQTTKQFLSESTTFLDTIVFAVGPLGILTAVVSCIRVAGSSFLKSFVGRAREPQGMAEIELCSSTSESVSELWSNGGICRVFGRPKILEFIYREPTDPKEYYPEVDSSGNEIPATCGIESTREFFENLESEPLTRPESEQRPTSTTNGKGSASDAETVSTAEQERPNPIKHWKAVSSFEVLFSPLSSIISSSHRKKSTLKAKKGPKAEPLMQPQNAPDLEKGVSPNSSKSSGDQNQSHDQPQTQTQIQTQSQTVGQTTQSNAQSGTQRQTQPQGQTQTQSQPGSQSRAQIQTQTQTQTEDKNQNQDQTTDQTQAQTQTQTQTKVESRTQGQTTQSQPQIQTQGDGQGGNIKDARAAEFAPFPNLALNIGVAKSSIAMVWLWLAAIIGVAAQVGIFVYAWWAVFVKNGFYEDGKLPGNKTFFWFTIAGTISLVIGMGLSANVIDRTSQERRFRSADGNGTRMFWLQPSGQRIGDQEFDGFAYDEMKSEYIASWKTEATKSAPQWLVWLAVFLSMAGWAVQFVGLRGVHGTISLYQLGTTIFMSILRAILRSHRTTPENYLKPGNKDIEGHELDWQALRFANDSDQFRDTPTFPRSKRYAHGLNSKVAPTANAFFIWDNDESRQMTRSIIQWIDTKESSHWSEKNGTTIILNAARAIRDGKDESRSSLPQSASRLMRIRTRLAFLTNQPPYQEWGGEARDMALRLKVALQKAAELFVSAHLFSDGRTERSAASIVWSTTCQLLEGGAGTVSPKEMPICFHMIRASDSWSIDEHQLEAVLGLWSWSFRKQSPENKENPGTNRKPLATTPGTSINIRVLLLQRWGLQVQELQNMSLPSGEFSNLSVPTLMSLRPAESSLSENNVKGLPVILSIDAKSSILCLMAQDSFTIFLERISLLMESGLDEVLSPEIKVSRARRASLIDDLAGILVSERLATTDEALMTIVPGLYRGREVIEPGNHLPLRLISHADSLKRQNKFGESKRAILGSLQTGTPRVRVLALKILCEIHRSECRWMAHQPSVLARSEFQSRIVAMREEWLRHPFEDPGKVALHSMYYCVLKWFLDSLYKPPGLEKPILPPIPNLCKHQPLPLDEEALESIQLDATDEDGDWESEAQALTLVEKYNLGASKVEIRRLLLRWGIESDCTGLVEDIWTTEQSLDDEESAFSGGSDELFWAVSLRTANQDMMSMILFLANVAQVSAVKLPQLGNEQQLDAWWAKSRKKGLITTKYERNLSAPLTVLSADKNGLEPVQLITQSPVKSLDGLPDAVLAATETGSLETVNYLYTKIGLWIADSFVENSPVELFQLLCIASRWGLKSCVEVTLRRQWFSTLGGGFRDQEIQQAIWEARAGLPSHYSQRAASEFHSDRVGVVALLEGALR
ncbi:hypothetical protein B0J13DRAFT_676672 [Dactylonectria estremocensis]|uniref:Uncharacterized protein n=1 Tax=Dactylonectria estremocensis TaxID=1079267 RepID=A0A9P9EIS1_9HYPO|nr:hypothetical protein B0J13DRAFT_676672 [Dactylonectria estremocensis]